MAELSKSLCVWNTPVFRQTLKSELESLPKGNLPLEKGTSSGGYVDDSNLSVSVLNVSEDEQFINAKLAVFFTEIVINCGCGEDPMHQHAQCEMQLLIDKQTAEASFTVIAT